ncbi:DUF5675 family protein [Bacteroides thetaiotaomicron]|uniref:DUF5675 family protein n=1 Tax=Bacteroides thetaiotaomicron TaxID=818 RepID=UPI0035AE63A3
MELGALESTKSIPYIKLTLKRKYLGDKYTVGDLFIDRKFFCNTIENTERELPVNCYYIPKGQSCKRNGEKIMWRLRFRLELLK